MTRGGDAGNSLQRASSNRYIVPDAGAKDQIAPQAPYPPAAGTPGNPRKAASRPTATALVMGSRAHLSRLAGRWPQIACYQALLPPLAGRCPPPARWSGSPIVWVHVSEDQYRDHGSNAPHRRSRSGTFGAQSVPLPGLSKPWADPGTSARFGTCHPTDPGTNGLCRRPRRAMRNRPTSAAPDVEQVRSVEMGP